MGLREIAQADMSTILADVTYGGAWLISVTDPYGNVTPEGFSGLSNDIAQMIDPDTGQAVSGRLASVSLSISALKAAGFGLPEAIASNLCKPWIVEFNDIGGDAHRFKVSKSHPDRTLGLVSCILEAYCD